MNRERLEHLIEVLEGVPQEKFNMTLWNCGTSACAMGWACKDQQFNEQGLQLSNMYLSASPIFDRSIGFAAASEFFEIDENEAHFIFNPLDYVEWIGAEEEIPISLVIKHIKQVLVGEPRYA